MKSLVVIGVPRAGKTTLAKEVCGLFSKHGIPVSFLSADSIIGGLTDVRKKNILWRIFVRPLRHIFLFTNKSNASLVKKMCAFVGRFINETSDIMPVIYEGAYIDPDTAVKIFDGKKCMIVVIGYPNSSVKEKLEDIRKFDKETPYSKRSDKQLSDILHHNIERSKKMYDMAKKYNLMYIDTSFDYNLQIKKSAKEIYQCLSK